MPISQLTLLALIALIAGAAWLARGGGASRSASVPASLQPPQEGDWSSLPYYTRYNTPCGKLHHLYAMPVTSGMISRSNGTNGYGGQPERQF